MFFLRGKSYSPCESNYSLSDLSKRSALDVHLNETSWNRHDDRTSALEERLGDHHRAFLDGLDTDDCVVGTDLVQPPDVATDNTSVDANKFVQFLKRDSTTWVELTRNF